MPASLEDTALQTYKENLHYFEKYQAAIYSKLAAFESAIEQNLYVSKYDLVINNEYFDVLELSTREYLYNSKAKEYGSLVSDSINSSKVSNVFETFKRVRVSDENLEKLATLSITQNNLSGFAPILNYIQNAMPHSLEMQNIKKFIFFGVGLGLHIPSVHQKITADIYLIVEDDLELFKLSLFTTPYYELAKDSTLIFSIFDSKKEFSAPAYTFLKSSFYHNHYIKYFQMINQSEEKLKEFQLMIASQSHNLFYYNAILEQYLKPLDYLQNHFQFLNILKPIFDEKPLLLLAAGPSLYKNIEWIKENQDRFMIVALSAVLSILEKEGISPDIVTHIDGLEESIVHFTKLNSLEFLKETHFLISSRTPREIVDLLKKENIFFFENGTSYKHELGNLSAPCVGSTTLLLLLALGAQDLYLLGLDLALDSKTGATHSSGHEYTKELELNTKSLDEDLISFKESILEVDGNFNQSVYTTPDFISSINSINSSTTGFKHNEQTIYNLSDGAYFSNTKAIHTQDIEVSKLSKFNKIIIKEKLKQAFKQNSVNSMSHIELSQIKKRHIHSLKITEIIQTQKSTSFTSHQDFLDSLETLFKNLCTSSSTFDYDLALIYQEYFRFIDTFIFDLFNTQEFEDPNKHVNRLNTLLTQQLLRIVELYTNQLNTVIKEEECKI